MKVHKGPFPRGKLSFDRGPSICVLYSRWEAKSEKYGRILVRQRQPPSVMGIRKVLVLGRLWYHWSEPFPQWIQRWGGLCIATAPSQEHEFQLATVKLPHGNPTEEEGYLTRVRIREDVSRKVARHARGSFEIGHMPVAPLP